VDGLDLQAGKIVAQLVDLAQKADIALGELQQLAQQVLEHLRPVGVADEQGLGVDQHLAQVARTLQGLGAFAQTC
jgi:hypothetical protein